MKLTVIIMIVVGIIAAACAAIFVGVLKTQLFANSPSAIREATVIIAKKPLEAMTVIKAEHLSFQKMPTSERTKKYMTDAAHVIGKVLSVPMETGQAFTGNCFATEGSSFYVASALPAGKRAVSISLTDYSALQGLLYPGSVVDVLATFPSSSGKNDAISTKLLEGVQILAIEDRTVFSEDSPKASGATVAASHKQMVTLMVDTKQAQALQLATTHGTVSLALRNPIDVSRGNTGNTSLKEIAGAEAVGLPDPPVARVPATQPSTQPQAPLPVWTTMIIRGTRLETKDFPLPAPQQ